MPSQKAWLEIGERQTDRQRDNEKESDREINESDFFKKYIWEIRTGNDRERKKEREREREKGIDRGNRLKDRKSMFVGTWGL